MLCEECGLVNGGLGLAVSLHSEVFLNALHASRRPAHEPLRGAALDGNAIGCFAVTEPTGGSDVAGIATTLVRGDGQWRLSGEKRYISNAGVATHVLVLARRLGADAGRLSVAIVPFDRSGVYVEGFFPKMGTWGADAAHLRFDDVLLTDDDLIGPIDGGLLVLMRCLTYERLAVSAQLLAGTRYILRLVTAYMRSRRQFGTRLFDLQALRHRLVDCWIELWAAEGLRERVVGRLLDGRGRPHETAALKLFAGRVAGRVADECMQFLGGRGYTMNYPIERFWRDARLARIGAGTDEIMRELLGSALDAPDATMEQVLNDLDREDIAIRERTVITE